jgi:hypothetical protein
MCVPHTEQKLRELPGELSNFVSSDSPLVHLKPAIGAVVKSLQAEPLVFWQIVQWHFVTDGPTDAAS